VASRTDTTTTTESTLAWRTAVGIFCIAAAFAPDLVTTSPGTGQFGVRGPTVGFGLGLSGADVFFDAVAQVGVDVAPVVEGAADPVRW
jgi:hypothetical protein